MPKKYVKRVRKGVRGSKRRSGRVGRSRRKNRSTPNLIVANFPGKNPVPRRYMCKLTYSQIITLSGSGVRRSADQVFSMNSCFDPDISGGGHQPRYFDQFSTMYSMYRVLGSSISVKALPIDSATPQQNIYVAVVPSNTDVSLNNSVYFDISELPYSRVKYGNLYGSRMNIKSYHKIHKIAGVSPLVVKNDDAFRAKTTNNPSTQTYWHVVAGTMDETSTSLACRALVTVTYYVSFEDPITPTYS